MSGRIYIGRTVQIFIHGIKRPLSIFPPSYFHSIHHKKYPNFFQTFSTNQRIFRPNQTRPRLSHTCACIENNSSYLKLDFAVEIPWWDMTMEGILSWTCSKKMVFDWNGAGMIFPSFSYGSLSLSTFPPIFESSSL